MLSFKLTLKRQPPFLVDSIDGMRYDEMEIDEESEPEVPVYDRAELIERYQVKTVFRGKTDVNIKWKKFQDLKRFLRP